jgi:hypothetical protein
MLGKGCFIRAFYSIVNIDLNKQIRQVNQPHCKRYGNIGLAMTFHINIINTCLVRLHIVKECVLYIEATAIDVLIMSKQNKIA